MNDEWQCAICGGPDCWTLECLEEPWCEEFDGVALEKWDFLNFWNSRPKP